MYLELQSSSKLLPSLYFLSLWIDFEASLDLQRMTDSPFLQMMSQERHFHQLRWFWIELRLTSFELFLESPVFSTNFKSRYFDFQLLVSYCSSRTDYGPSDVWTYDIEICPTDFGRTIVLTSYFSSKLFQFSSKFINFWFSIQLSSASFFNNFSILHFFPDVILSSLDVVQCIFEFWWYIISPETMREDWDLYVNQFT